MSLVEKRNAHMKIHASDEADCSGAETSWELEDWAWVAPRGRGSGIGGCIRRRKPSTMKQEAELQREGSDI